MTGESIASPSTTAEAPAKHVGLGSDWSSALKQFPKTQFVFSKTFGTLDEAIQSGPGLLDLFSGARGFARAFVRDHSTWAICFDIKHSLQEDLLKPDLLRTLLDMIAAGAFRALAASPVCASFSTAITPPWRTKEHPAGIPTLTPLQCAKVQLGQQQLSFTLQLVRCCLRHHVVFWVENPDGSWFWKQVGDLSWDDILADTSVGDLRVEQCMFGTAWRKRTKFRTNCHLRNQKLICNRQHQHVVLRGRCRERKVNFTKLAEAYPRSLCSALSFAMGMDSGLSKNRRKLDINACARCGVFRIGEAGHPGPRQPARVPRSTALDDFELLEPQTIAIRKKFWDQFQRWLEEKLGVGALEDCLAAPVLLVKSLEVYGHEAFASGLPLHYFRQLLAHVQREYPLSRSWEWLGLW